MTDRDQSLTRRPAPTVKPGEAENKLSDFAQHRVRTGAAGGAGTARTDAARPDVSASAAARKPQPSAGSEQGEAVLDASQRAARESGSVTPIGKNMVVPGRPERKNPLPGPLPTLRTEQWPNWTPPAEAEPEPVRPVGPVIFTMPARRRKRSYKTLISFLIFVVLPLAAVARYYWFYASDQYVSEFRFAVTETTPSLPGGTPSVSSSTSTSAGNLASAASAIIGNYSVSNAAAQNFVVVDYLLSRQAVEELEKRIKVRELYSRPEADWWQRFDASQPMEKFIDYWGRMVSASYDPVTGIATAQVKAFRPDDAYLIAKTLVTLSEELVNRIAMRPQLDAVRYAESEARKAEERLNAARAAMNEYRIKEGVIDPTSSVVTSNVQLMQSLQANLAQLQTQLNSLARQQLDPNAPALQVLRSRIQATKDELARVEKEVGQTREGTRPLTEVMAKFEQLNLDLQYAQNFVVSSRQMLDQARANAAAQHLYLTPYVTPAIPESATYPKRGTMILMYGLAFFGLWLIGLLIVRSIREHTA